MHQVPWKPLVEGWRANKSIKTDAGRELPRLVITSANGEGHHWARHVVYSMKKLYPRFLPQWASKNLRTWRFVGFTARICLQKDRQINSKHIEIVINNISFVWVVTKPFLNQWIPLSQTTPTRGKARDLLKSVWTQWLHNLLLSEGCSMEAFGSMEQINVLVGM